MAALEGQGEDKNELAAAAAAAEMVSLFASTPATSLTRALPHGSAADVLVLQSSSGGGSTFDVRDVLYTAYAERGVGLGGGDGDGSGSRVRKGGGIRILLCQEEAAVVARDLLFLTLVLDSGAQRAGEAGQQPDDGGSDDGDEGILWEAFNDLFVPEAIFEKVIAQADKLVGVAGAKGRLEAWNASTYGHALGFHDESTLQQVRQVWEQYRAPNSELRAAQFRESLGLSQKIRDAEQVDVDKQISLSGLRSAAPVPLASGDIVSRGFKQFWEHGSLTSAADDKLEVEKSEGRDKTEPRRLPNPLMAACLLTSSTNGTSEQKKALHYSSNPLLGYHLGAALARLAPGSPYSILQTVSDGDEYANIVTSVRIQFREWANAFREMARERGINLQYCVNPLTDFLRTLSDDTQESTEQKTSRSEVSRRFDIIDTTSCADEHGFLNLLVASRPLLRPSPASVIYTETLKRQPGLSYKQNLDLLMCGDALLNSLVIDLSPVEYWTNTSTESCIDDVLIRGSVDGAQTSGILQGHFRASWRLTDHFSGTVASGGRLADEQLLFMEDGDASTILANVLSGLLRQEQTLMATKEDAEILSTRLLARFKTFTLLLLRHVRVKWDSVAASLMSKLPDCFTASTLSPHESCGTKFAVFSKEVHQMLSERDDDGLHWTAQKDVNLRISPRPAGQTVMIAHLNLKNGNSEPLLEQDAPVRLQQQSPFLISVIIDGDGAAKYSADVIFPMPVLASKVSVSTGHQISQGASLVDSSALENAHARSFIELTAQVVDPIELEDFSELILPIRIASLPNSTNKTPIALNNHSVNLDSLPIVSVDNNESDAVAKKANAWLATLTSQQFSTRERKERELAYEDDTLPPSAKLNLKESIFTIFMLASGLQGGNTGLFTLSHPTKGNQILIFVRAIRLDGSAGSVVADAAVLPVTRELLDSGELETFLLVLRELDACVIEVTDEELVLWKRVLPAMVERCRTSWEHTENCEYFSSSSCYSTVGGHPTAAAAAAASVVPLSVEPEKPFLCSCGNGRLPERYMGGLPEWEESAARHAVRVAISPLFAVPWVEDIMDVELVRSAGGVEGMVAASRDRCRRCGATERAGETVDSTAGDGDKKRPLMRCTRCKDAMYCSHECQKKDWKKHRMECRAPGQVE
ncbi:uncharacterized protein B0I36DRAFT_363627 [Microdochium trichocladiopsis]|uniref:MYND-type domain-containing protein n=1 Tax=Microdochium trichocladiopsis TaxID=1682393 RepID=A0A9P8Y3Q5_9PEZI|nr:uncharacterized protein B0I36DRAFT_363627 [Microdochium trichocladiopsis]KAH7029027.1 hypothetical protein B0I36DRAFT_363627 [Microdochium trichocladiopsis]